MRLHSYRGIHYLPLTMLRCRKAEGNSFSATEQASEAGMFDKTMAEWKEVAK